jgi:hypothetical protein
LHLKPRTLASHARGASVAVALFELGRPAVTEGSHKTLVSDQMTFFERLFEYRWFFIAKGRH